MATKFNALDQFLLSDKPEDENAITSVDEPGTYESEDVQPRLMREISDAANATKRAWIKTPTYELTQLFAGETTPGVIPAKAQAFIPESLRQPGRKLGGFSQFREGTAPLKKLDNPVEDEAGDLPPSMQTVPDLRAPDLRSAPAAQQIKESAFGNMKLTQPAIQPVPTVQTPVQKTEGTPSEAVAKMTEDAGGDEPDLDRMLSAANWIRAMESTGSAISGKNLRSGIADSLGEQARQVQAMRLKRAEKAEDITRDQAQNESANLATLTTNLAAFKDRPEVVAALENLKPALKNIKHSDFLKDVFQAVTNPPKVEGLEAGARKTQAGEVRLLGQAATEEAARPGKIGLVENKVRSEAERTQLLKEQTALTAAKAEDLRAKREHDALVREVGSTKGPLSDPKLEQKRKDAFRKDTTAAGKLYTEPTQQLASLERVSGDLLAGKTPAWWNPVNIQRLKSGVTDGLPPDMMAFAKRYNAVINPLRHGLFGSALTDGEQKAFADQIEIALLKGPQDLGTSLNELMLAQKDKTKLRLGYLFDEMPDLAQNWMQTSGFAEAIKGTSFEEMFPAPKAAVAVEPPGAPSAATITIKRKTDGKTKTVPAADKAKWLADPDFEEVK